VPRFVLLFDGAARAALTAWAAAQAGAGALRAGGLVGTGGVRVSRDLRGVTTVAPTPAAEAAVFVVEAEDGPAALAIAAAGPGSVRVLPIAACEPEEP
jgi:hypothetical protein